MRSQEIWRRLGNLPLLLSVTRDMCLDIHDSFSQRPFAKLYRQVRPYTMCGNARLRGLYRAVEHVVTHRISGDLVECGAARGGSAALMGLTLKQMIANRTLWVFDTFEGIPPPTQADPDWEIARLYTGDFRGTLPEVSDVFDRLGILEHCKLVKGVFQETLPPADIATIAVLHIDGDWYESVKVCLDQLYDRVSPGGVIQIDDYGHWEGARKAVDEFLQSRAINIRPRALDYSGRQLLKP